MQATVFSIYSLFTIGICALLNHVRGGTDIPFLQFMNKLPKSTYWLWIFIFPIAYVFGFNWIESLILAIGSLIWAIPAWSRWASLGHITPAYGEGRPLSFFEQFIDVISFNISYLGLFFRHIVCLIPVVAAMSYFVGLPALFLFLIAPGSVIGYSLGWTFFDHGKVSQPFPIGEYVTGAFAGLSLVLLHYFALGCHTLFI